MRGVYTLGVHLLKAYNQNSPNGKNLGTSTGNITFFNNHFKFIGGLRVVTSKPNTVKITKYGERELFIGRMQYISVRDLHF